MLIALAGSALVGLGNDAVTIVAGWAVAVVGYTLSTSMLLAYLGDRLPEEQRGKVMGINGAITQIGPIVGIVIAGSFASQLGLMFLIPAAIAFLGPVWFLVSMRDSQYSGALPPFRFSDLTRGFYFNPRRHTNFGWVILSKLFVYASLAFGGLYGIYLLQARLGLDTGAVATLIATVAGLGVFTAIIGAIGAGWLSDKLRSRKPFLIASGVLLVASPLIVGTTTSTLQFIVGGLVGTFAIGIYGSVDQALALDTLPSDENENGRYLAIFGLANGIPQAFGPFAAAFVLTLAGGDYSWVYYVAAAFAALGALSIIPISVGKRASLSTVSIDAVS